MYNAEKGKMSLVKSRGWAYKYSFGFAVMFEIFQNKMFGEKIHRQLNLKKDSKSENMGAGSRLPPPRLTQG